MEVESLGGLPFLDVYIYHKGDGILGHCAHRKPTHTDLYFNSHHLAQKTAVLSTLVRRAWVVSDLHISQENSWKRFSEKKWLQFMGRILGTEKVRDAHEIKDVGGTKGCCGFVETFHQDLVIWQESMD